MSAVPDQTVAAAVDDDRKLEELGYIPSFRREFSNLATVRHCFLEIPCALTSDKPIQISFAFSIMVFSSV